MAERSATRVFDDESSLSARAAWLYYSAGLTQGEVARRLDVPSTKAHRLIARATKAGLVRVFVDASVADCVALEEALSARYGLTTCRVAPDLGEHPLPIKALAIAGASYLRRVLERGEHTTIGVGHGRTLAAAIDYLAPIACENVCFVSMLGGLTRRFGANPYDVIHRLAERTGAEGYLLPVPLFANAAQDRPVLLQQIGVADVFALSREATLLIVGIGEVAPTSHLAATGTIRPDELEDLERAGAVGEFLGHFFDQQGRPVTTGLAGRVMAPAIDALSDRNLVAIAGGRDKVDAIAAVLASGLLRGLVTDEVTARALTQRQQENSFRDQPGTRTLGSSTKGA